MSCLQPALIQIKPYGVDISPIALDIEPLLISIRPRLETIAPQGLKVGPNLINVRLSHVSAQTQGHTRHALLWRCMLTIAYGAMALAA